MIDSQSTPVFSYDERIQMLIYSLSAAEGLNDRYQ